MTQASQMLTPTLAQIYENQGHYEKAARVYRHLLDLEPDRRDLAQKLARVRQLAAGPAKDLERATASVSRWIRAALRLRDLRMLAGNAGQNRVAPALDRVSAFIEKTTGAPPTQEELCDALTRYFVLNEIKGHILASRNRG